MARGYMAWKTSGFTASGALLVHPRGRPEKSKPSLHHIANWLLINQHLTQLVASRDIFLSVWPDIHSPHSQETYLPNGKPALAHSFLYEVLKRIWLHKSSVVCNDLSGRQKKKLCKPIFEICADMARSLTRWSAAVVVAAKTPYRCWNQKKGWCGGCWGMGLWNPKKRNSSFRESTLCHLVSISSGFHWPRDGKS